MSVLVGGKLPHTGQYNNIDTLVYTCIQTFQYGTVVTEVLQSNNIYEQPSLEVTTTAHIAASNVRLQLQHTYLHQYTGPVYESESCMETTVCYDNIIQQNYTHQGTILYLLHPLPPSSVVSSFLSLFRHDGVHTIANGYAPSLPPQITGQSTTRSYT